MSSAPLNVSKYLPLWSAMDTHNAGHQEYYEVQIYADENYVENVKDIDEILNTTTFRCNICNIDVPNAYNKEHIQSTKHDTCLKITNIALERANLFIKADLIDAKLKVEVKGTYFCEPCAIIVKNSDKHKHNQSDKHVNYVNNDKLLQELVKIYENPQTDGEIANKMLSENDFELMLRKFINPIAEDSEILRDNETVNETPNVLDKEIKENDGNMKVVKKAKTKKHKNKKFLNKSKVNLTEIVVTEEETNEVDKHEPVLVFNYKSNETKQNPKETDKNTENPQIVSKNELSDKAGISTNKESDLETNHYIEIISKEFPSINVRAISDDIVEIEAVDGKTIKIPVANFHGYKVCENYIACNLCYDDWNPKHMWTEEHKINVTNPMDEHCLRKLTLRKISGSSRHCVLCNTIVSDFKIADHIVSTDHVNNLQKYVVQNKFTKKIHRVTNKNHLTLTYDGTAMFCKICEIEIVKEGNSILKHIHSVLHVELFVSFKRTNGIQESGSEYYCSICEKNLWSHYLITHCKWKQHKKKLFRLKRTCES